MTIRVVEILLVVTAIFSSAYGQRIEVSEGKSEQYIMHQPIIF